MPGGQGRDADDVDVLGDRQRGRFLRRLEQRADLDLEAEIGKGRGDHLLPAVVPVLADLGDEDARRPPVIGGEARDRPPASLDELVRRSQFPGVNS